LACSSVAPTQATVVVRPGDACNETTPFQDPYDAVLARARCEHPDMLVHPLDWIVRRAPSPPGVRRFALEHQHQVERAYEVDATGAVRHAP
jgi:hypothetical protein